MTGEEKQKAINALKISAPIMAMTQEEFNDYIQTLNKIMDWLEQETCDVISREEAIDACNQSVNILEATDRIKDLPSVTPQPKIGHWKRISMDKYSEHAKYWYRCDRCGRDNLGNTNYCPNCGCAMKGELK